MLIFTVDADGQPGHPTRRGDLVRKLLRRKQARLIGGGASGRPPVLHYLHHRFDPDRTVARRFVVFEDTGFVRLGFCVAEVIGDRLVVLARGVLLTRTPLIKGVMDERRKHRRARRHYRRKRTRRRSVAQGRNLNKQRPPRWKNRKKRESVTIRHAVGTHLTLFDRLLTLCPLPRHQVVLGFEYARFDLRKMLWGPVAGAEYQVSPRGKKRGERDRDFVLRRFDGRCFVCRTTTNLQIHHVQPRSEQGSERAENKVVLCRACHSDVHCGLLVLPLKGTKHEWRATTNTNIVCGILKREQGLRYVHAGQVACKRRALGLEKRHDLDAVAGAAALVQAATVELSQCFYVELRQVRRHRRARIHAQRNRIYKLRDGSGKLEVVAHNRRRASEQKQPSLAEFRAARPQDVGRLVVNKAVRILAPDRCKAPALPGEIWQLPDGQSFLVEGLQHRGESLHGKQLRTLIGRTYVRRDHCLRLQRNQGLVVVPINHGGGASSPP